MNVSIGLICGQNILCNKRLRLSQLAQNFKYSLPYSHQMVLEISFVKQTTSLKCKWFLQETISFFSLTKLVLGHYSHAPNTQIILVLLWPLKICLKNQLTPTLWSKHFAMAFKS